MGLALSFLILAVTMTSAYTNYPTYYSNNYNNYYSNTYPTYSQSASANSGSNSQYFNFGPITSRNTYYDSKFASSNFDSTDYALAYQGPMASRAITYDSYLKIKPSGKVIQTVSYADKSNFVGEIALETANSRNRRTSASETIKTSTDNSWKGYTWSNKEAFDNSKYSQNSGWDNYYYRPVFSNGYYNWDW